MKKLTLTLLFAIVAVAMQAATTIYLKIGEGIVTADSDIAVWIWKDSQNFTGGIWPGTKLTETKTIGDSDYFVYTFDTDGAYNIIFNNNGGGSQTGDIKNLQGDYTFVLNGWGDNNYTQTAGAPSETPVVKLYGEKYGKWAADSAVELTYDESTGEYTYTETTPANLAKEFKVTIDNSWYRADVALPTTDFTALYDGSNMTLSGAADYAKITLTVKKIDGAWKIKVVGEKETVVKIKGVFNDWTLTELERTDGTYTITVAENITQLADGFGFEIDGVYYAGDIELELDGDAVAMTGYPGGKNIRLANDGHYEIILTVAKKGSNWTVQATQGEVSAVETVGAETATVVAGNGEIVVEGAQSVAVYTAAGALVSTDARTRVAAGLYIVRADNAVKKVIVK